jgi:hypothetical protein
MTPYRLGDVIRWDGCRCTSCAGKGSLFVVYAIDRDRVCMRRLFDEDTFAFDTNKGPCHAYPVVSHIEGWEP